ncbi:MAG TPA: ABC transporter permease [Gemmatimonadaceae bacterium]
MRPSWPGLRRVFRLPSNDARLRDDVDAELEFHIHGRMEELMSQGMLRDDAEREARRRFGDFSRIEHEVTALDRGSTRRRSFRDRVDGLANDVRYAIRSLRRQPVFAAVVVLTLTLGMGATAAIFHAVDRITLHPLPYPHPEQIAYLGLKRTKGLGSDALTGARYQFWHDQTHIFDALATYRPFQAIAGDPDAGPSIHGMRVTGEFFAVVGTQPFLGRVFSPAELSVGGDRVALLSYPMWQRQFAGDRTVLGRTLRLGDSTYTVIGVLPESFEFAGNVTPDAILPWVLSSDDVQDDGGANYTALGRLRVGVSPEQINDEMATLWARFRATHTVDSDPGDAGVELLSYQKIYFTQLVPELWLMLGATGFVFLLACANVGNIVFARALSRRREFAVRTALGAGRGRIVRQIVIEMVILGIIAAVMAIGVSLLAVRALVGLAHQALMRDSQLHLDMRVVVYTTLLALAASLIVGAIVALGTTRIDLARGLSGSSRGGGLGARHGRVRDALVALESTIAMVLLTGAGLLIASFTNVLHVDGGFRRDGVFTAAVGRVPRDYTDAATIVRFENQVLERLRATPGITSAAATASLPLTRGMNIPTTVEGHNDRTEGPTEWRSVSPTFFRTMDVRVLAGRDFGDADVASAPAVAIVSQAYARNFFHDENPIGQRILIGYYKGQKTPFSDQPRTIVGVVADLKDGSLERMVRHTVWVPQAQANGQFSKVPSFVVRASDAGIASTALRSSIADAEPRMRSVDIMAMGDLVSASLANRRFSTVLMTTFALLALVLTCVGIYGVASYSVSQRVQEIGLRMALGAEPRGVIALVVGEGVRPAAIGLVLGLIVALSLSKVLTHMLFGVSAHDPKSMAAVGLVLIIVAALASYFPARRAARVDPVSALRAE